jgi:hypothetical protein
MTLLHNPTTRSGRTYFDLIFTISSKRGTNPNERTVKKSTIDSLSNKRVRGESEVVSIFANVVEVDAAKIAAARAVHPIILESTFP